MAKTINNFSPEVHERAIRMVLDHEKDYRSRWAAMESISEKIGCTAQTLSNWGKRYENNSVRGFQTSVFQKDVKLKSAPEVLY